MMRVIATVIAAALALAAPGNIADQLLAIKFLNVGVVTPSDNLTLLTQCAGFSEDTAQVRRLGS